MNEENGGVQRPRASAPTERKGGGQRPFWSLRQAAQRDGVLQLYIYGDVKGDGYNWSTGERIESDTSAEHFREALGQYPEAREIEIYINSYGGEVFEGTAIYNQLKRHPAHKTVYIDGFACSIASVIAMAGDEIVMPRNTMMMIHNMWMGAVGNAAQLRKAADDLDVINAAGRQAYLLKAGDKLSEERLIAMMDAEAWLTAEQCLELGLADRLAEQDADLSDAAAILQRVNMSLEQQVERNRAIAARAREIAAEGDPPVSRPADSPLYERGPRENEAGIDCEGTRAVEDASPYGETGRRAAAGVGPYGEEPGGEAEAKTPTLMELLAKHWAAGLNLNTVNKGESPE